jgi:hypothetical protein
VGGRLTPDEVAWVGSCPVVATPKPGVHVWARLPGPVKGTVYARHADRTVMIETRGEGHCAVAPGSPPRCHPSGRPYLFASRGWLAGGPAEPIPFEVFLAWTVAAAELNEYVRLARVVGDLPRPAGTPAGDRPGDHFNARVSWDAVLTRHGWRPVRRSGETVYWCRPGKPDGVSATTGFCRGESSGDLLYVFSSNAAPFEPGTAYSRFAADTLLEHRGDWAAATRALAAAGYGSPLPRRKGVVR